MCKVKENAKTSENITNIADITEYKDENKDIEKKLFLKLEDRRG